MLTETAYAKINLALHVRRRRVDGYHELETLFAFLDDGDRLSGHPHDSLSLELAGPFGEALAAESDNLVLRAAAALAKAFGIRSGARLLLEKRLPIASGLGGGSADAAAALRLLCRLWELDVGAPVVRDIAIALGADVPACLESRTLFGTGVGERLTRCDDCGVEGSPVLLVNPMVACPTGAVFAAWDGVDRGPLDPARWRCGRNDLTPPAVNIVPAIADCLAELDRLPHVTLTRMSGSGATCFALFKAKDACDSAQVELHARQPGYWTMTGRLR